MQPAKDEEFVKSYKHTTASILHTPSGIKCVTKLSHGAETTTAYLGARFSRSALGLEESIAEIKEFNISANDRLNKILGYGHSSVANMCNISISIEGISIFAEMTLFNLLPIHQGQARSTRYQDFSKPAIVPLLSTKNEVEQSAYMACYEHAFKAYNAMYEPTKKALLERFWRGESEADLSKANRAALRSRTLDCTRYLLPLCTKTSIFLQATALEWSRLIARLKQHAGLRSRELVLIAQMLESLLLKQGPGWPDAYEPDADGLIRYTDADTSDESSEIWLPSALAISQQAILPCTSDCTSYVLSNASAMEQLAIRALHVARPHEFVHRIDVHDYHVQAMLAEIGKHWGKLSHHAMLGHIARSGSIMLGAIIDIGSQRDWSRHKSCSVHLPFADNGYATADSLKLGIAYCPYLTDLHPELDRVREQYAEHNERQLELSEQFADCYEGKNRETLLKYTLPLGMRAPITIASDISSLHYMLKLRVRNGGHIAYRQLAERWIKALSEQNTLYKHLFESQIADPVDATSFEQFIDRS